MNIFFSAGRAVGQYSITLDNGPAFREGFSKKLQEVSELWGVSQVKFICSLLTKERCFFCLFFVSRSFVLMSHFEHEQEPFEVSVLRKDDFEFVKPKNSDYDVLQCNTQPSSMTSRGHQVRLFQVVRSQSFR